jgi:hypothetical protein
MTHPTHSIIVVTPVYEDFEASSWLFRELHTEFGSNVYVVAVDDGSVRQPLNSRSLSAAGVEGCVLKLRRNMGHQQAIAVGLFYVSQLIVPLQRVVIMDSDGEDLPSSISQLLKLLEQPATDIVVAQRKKRSESPQFRAFYLVYKRFFSIMTGRSISFGNFMALKPDALKRLVALPELSIHVAAAVLASKLRTETCPLDRGTRYAGQSKMNFVGLTLHGFKALMVFSEDVMVRVGIACALIASLSVFIALVATALKLIGLSTPGWFSIALGILVIVFLQTGALALMTLMLTGNIRGGRVTSDVTYNGLIDSVSKTSELTKLE